MYRIKNFDKEYLESKGFKYNGELSDLEVLALSRKSTVYRYKNYNLLELTIVIYSNTNVTVNVYSANTNEPYSAWYMRKYGKNKVVEIIDAFVKKECRKLGIKKIGGLI